ncbi:MAG: YafY family protein [Caldilineaceae bacterium]
MRADRLLSILLLLQTHGRLTAGTLAELLEVSERTIQRDMEALSMAGIPVYADRGIGGGWSLVEGFVTQLTELTPAEIETLFLVKPLSLLTDLGMSKTAKTALDKLLALLPAIYRRAAALMRQCIHIDLMDLPQASEQVPFLPLLQAAIWQERQIQITYIMSNGARLAARVAPLGLVARGNVWYLVASYADQGKNQLGVYRVARIQTAALTDQPVNRPPEFDLAACWEELHGALMAKRTQYQVTAHVHASILSRLRCGGRLVNAQTEPLSASIEAWHAVVLHFATAEEACDYLLAFGPHVEVIAPPALREMVYMRALATASRYADG